MANNTSKPRVDKNGLHRQYSGNMNMTNSLNTSVRQWTLEEDNLLRRLVNEPSEDGTTDWARIALELSKKTATQCRFRWINTIYPAMILRGEAEDVPSLNNQFETFHSGSSNSCKKITVPPFKGPLGIDVYAELPSKKGIEVANVKKNSPLYGKIHKGDTIIQFMETPLLGIAIKEFVKIVKDTENETRYFIISTPITKDTSTTSSSPKKEGKSLSSSISSIKKERKSLKSTSSLTNESKHVSSSISSPKKEDKSSSLNSCPTKEVCYVPNINLDEDENVGNGIGTFTATGMDLNSFNEVDIAQMPICFAFNPGDEESQRIATIQEKRYYHDNFNNFEMRKKQKVHR